MVSVCPSTGLPTPAVVGSPELQADKDKPATSTKAVNADFMGASERDQAEARRMARPLWMKRAGPPDSFPTNT
ncbi:hypothetical protein GCM10009554_01930 [Kribbella koreensis]|uniref:Uncharacterized protein n=1 Tax=Kribbella koreensis TaxID=57909 RepID=A0ABP3ZNW3_9ACTN